MTVIAGDAEDAGELIAVIGLPGEAGKLLNAARVCLVVVVVSVKERTGMFWVGMPPKHCIEHKDGVFMPHTEK